VTSPADAFLPSSTLNGIPRDKHSSRRAGSQTRPSEDAASRSDGATVRLTTARRPATPPAGKGELGALRTCTNCGRSSVGAVCPNCNGLTAENPSGGLGFLVVAGAILFGAVILIQLIFIFGALVLSIILVWVETLRQLRAPPVAYVGSALLGVLALIVYLIPGFVANKRHTERSIWVWVVGLLLGWTVIGWIIALGMAVSGKTEARDAVSGQGTLGASPIVSQDGQWVWYGKRWHPIPPGPRRPGP
jgi:hypothetical protein